MPSLYFGSLGEFLPLRLSPSDVLYQYLNLKDFDSVKKFFKRNGYNWTLLDTKGDMSVVESYKVKVYPSYFLIDVDGTLCMSPATSPSEGFESRFKQLFQSRHH